MTLQTYMDLSVGYFTISDVTSIIAETAMPSGAKTDIDPVESAQEIISMLRITIIHICLPGGIPCPITNLYIQWPFENDEAWSKLTMAVAKTNYQDSLLSSGLYHLGWMCTICHGTDHPSGLCRLPLVLGSIKAAQIPPVVDYHIQLRNPNSQTPGRQLRGQGCNGIGNRGGNGRDYAAHGQGGSAHGCGGFNPV